MRDRLRTVRHALPKVLERIARGPGPEAAARRCRILNRSGIAATVGYFHAEDEKPDDIVAATLAVARLVAAQPGDVYLSLKAPPLQFSAQRIARIAQEAAKGRLGLMFDAHALRDAEPTLELASSLARDFPDVGVVLPARWRRSGADAGCFRDTSARIRVVKGEWADPDWTGADVETNYLSVIARLSGRAAPVSVATHDPGLAERALRLLLAADTPCELEQLRGLPSRRTTAIARRLGVRIRTYVPFGPGWWPYALDKALDRPHLLSWMVKDRFGASRALVPQPN